MHRDPLLALLNRYRPTAEEVAAFDQIVSFVRREPRCFDRDLEEGHITASAWLLNHTGDAALLLHHAKLGIWVQPGGHCDGNPDVLSCALREAQEESGIPHVVPVSTDIFDIDVHPVPGHLHYDIRFLLRVTQDVPAQINHESRGLLWVKETLPTRHRSVVRMWEKWSLSKHRR